MYIREIYIKCDRYFMYTFIMSVYKCNFKILGEKLRYQNYNKFRKKKNYNKFKKITSFFNYFLIN